MHKGMPNFKITAAIANRDNCHVLVYSSVSIEMRNLRYEDPEYSYLKSEQGVLEV